MEIHYYYPLHQFLAYATWLCVNEFVPGAPSLGLKKGKGNTFPLKEGGGARGVARWKEVVRRIMDSQNRVVAGAHRELQVANRGGTLPRCALSGVYLYNNRLQYLLPFVEYPRQFFCF